MNNTSDYIEHIIAAKKLLTKIENNLRNHRIYDAHAACPALRAEVDCIKNWAYEHLKEDKSCW